jgi:hypothetical protein
MSRFNQCQQSNFSMSMLIHVDGLCRIGDGSEEYSGNG